MKTMKIWRIAFVMLAAFSLASCSSDEPQWADPEAHEKTEQLRELSGPCPQMFRVGINPTPTC